MIAGLSRLLDRWRGGGDQSITTPPMDGALQPNRAIEEAPSALAVAAPDNLVRLGAEVLFSTGERVMRLTAGEAVELARFPAEVSCLAAGPDGALAAGLADGRLQVRGGRHDGLEIAALGGHRIVCPTALVFEGDAAVILALGSATNPPTAWKRDLMQRGADGAVWRVPLDGRPPECLARGLAFPYGLMASGGRIVVAESWRSRLVAIEPGRPVRPLLVDLPGYPARIAPGSGDVHAWLTVFAPRSQLVEFVLRERGYCDEMIRDIPEDYWIAPALKAPHSFLEPLQGGSLKQLGTLKPWAPTRSFGLVLALDTNFQPLASWHSRADGTRHGITSCLEDGGRLLLASKGGDVLVGLPLPGEKVGP